MKTIKQKLKGLGIKDKEIEIYLSILSIGKGTITDISKRSEIKRTSVYQHLEVLLKGNLIYQTVLGKRVFYVAKNPKNIIRLLENKKREIDNEKRSIEKIMPSLESLYAASFSRPGISFYEGRDGIKSVYKEMTSNQKNIYSFFSPKKFFSLFSYEENDELLMELFNNGGMLYNLTEKSDETLKRFKIDRYNKFVKSKILPEKFKFDTDILIGKDVVALISFDNRVAVVVRDVAIAGLQKNIFKMIWKSL